MSDSTIDSISSSSMSTTMFNDNNSPDDVISNTRSPNPRQQSSLLSLSLSELTTVLGGGSGRALACWDCFRLGVDPLWFHSSSSPNHTNSNNNDINHNNIDLLLEPPVDSNVELSSPHDNSATSSIIKLQPWTRQQIIQQMPSSRRSSANLGQTTLLPLLLSGNSSLKLPETMARLQQVTTSLDGTTKLLLQFGNENDDSNNNNNNNNSTFTDTTTTTTSLIETVIIPWPERQSSTLCVSSQVGCRQACTFCATGRIMGRGRNLTADEIVAQVYWAQKVIRMLVMTTRDNDDEPNNGDGNRPPPPAAAASTPLLYPIDNVVFMGMGEPADNAPNVMRAVQVLLDPLQFQLAPRKVTISTVAPTPQAFEWLSCTSPSYGGGSSYDDDDDKSSTLSPPSSSQRRQQQHFVASLAWSIHSSRDEIRKRLVPTTRYSMIELRQGLIQTLMQRPRKSRSILLSVTLLHGINDRDEDALHLIDFCQPILQQVPGVKLVVNVIPWNPFEPADGIVSTGMPNDLAPPTWERILAFQTLLTQHQLLCYIRTTRGDDTNAACGQLATNNRNTLQ